jgi:hypothetical protein
VGLRTYVPPPPERGAGSDQPIDAVLVDHRALLRELDRSLARNLSVTAERALDPGRVRLSNATALVGAVTQFRRQSWASAGGARIESRLPSLVDQAGLDRRALTTPVLLATVQLDALVMLMLLVVARMAADARAGEIALAKLRGASSRQAFLLATYELAVVNLVAFPLALAVAWGGVSALARVQLRPGVPVAVTLPALGVAAVVSVAALATAALAGTGPVRRRVLELWRRGRPAPGTRHGLVLELVLLAAATLGMVSLRLGGLRQGGGWDPVALLAPALAVLAGGLLAARALPGTGGAFVAALVDLERLLLYGRDTRLAGRAHLWAAAGPEADAAVGRLERLGVQIEQDLTAAQRRADLGRQAPALALLLLALGAAVAAVLATGGVMLHLYLDGRRRRFELAVLDAIGARHRDLWLPLALEHAVLVGGGCWPVAPWGWPPRWSPWRRCRRSWTRRGCRRSCTCPTGRC